MDIESGGSFKIAGTAVTASAAELNLNDGVTATTAELNFLAGVTAGTSAASKAIVLSGTSKIDAIDITALTYNGTLISSTPVELNLTDNMPGSITFAAASAASNVSEVTITVKDAAGSTIASVYNIDIWLSDAATCAGLTSTSASGTVAVKSASGADIGTYTAKKALRVQTLVSGVYILEITDSAKTTFYPCATLPSTGETEIGTQLASGDYGA